MVRIMIVNINLLLVKLLWMDPSIFLCSKNLFCPSIHLGSHHPFVHWTKHMALLLFLITFHSHCFKPAFQVLSLFFWRVKSVTPAKDLKSLPIDSLVYIPVICFICLRQSNVWFLMIGICFYCYPFCICFLSF